MHQLRWIFGLTALATVAIVGLQAYIWRQGIQQEHDRFSRSLHHAVYEATEEFMRPLESTIRIVGEATGDTLALRRPGFIALQIGEADTNFSLELSPASAAALHGHLLMLDDANAEITKAAEMDSVPGAWVYDQTDTLANRFFFRQRQLCPDCQSGFSRLSADNFKPLLEEELARLGIDTEFHWGVRHLGNWLIVDGDTTLLDESAWNIPFFTFPIGTLEHTFEMAGARAGAWGAFSPPVVSLFFPSERWLLLRNIGPTLLASTLLAFLVLGCIGYALHVILRQKQLSEIKTDFINNMTHELKTPISTIALACEAMQDTGVSIPPASQQHYLKMISAESSRLATQVEKVLQMAQLDKKDLDLKIESVDVHALLQEAIGAFALQMEQRKGTITAALHARINTVEGDLLHLRQMFINLLDNANKYSPEAPEIRVETKNVYDGIEIAFHDKGLGISRDALRKVFDRFYRVPTGNVHDVKGFGLGLSYVQTMAVAHGGRVYARSKPGAGSSFYLFLPNPDA